MTVTEQSRHLLYERLDEVLGHDQATTLMEHLPPVGWADVSTKKDLDHQSIFLKSELDQRFTTFRTEMDGRFAKIDDRFAKIDDRFDKVDDRLDSLRSEMDERFRNSDARLHEVEMRVFEQEKHFVVLRGQMDSLASTLRAELHRELRVHLLALAGLGVTATGIILGAM